MTPLSQMGTDRERITISGTSIGLWGKYYYAPFDITHYFPSDVGFKILLFVSTRQVGVGGG